MGAGSGAGTGGPEVDEQPEDGEGSAAGSGSESDPHEPGDPGPDADTAQAEASADDDDLEPDEAAAATMAIEVEPPATTAGPRFVAPRYDPPSLPPAEFVDSVDLTPEPDAPSPAVRPQVPQQYATGGVPIVEIEGGWDAVYRRRRRQTLTFVAGFFVVVALGCLAWLTYAGVVPWPFGGSVTVAQNVCTHSKPLAPKKISVRVFNGSGRDGLARQVAAQLKALGFAVKTTGNDPLESRIKTQVEIRHGDSGDVAAATMSAYVVGRADDVQDDRQDSSIDLVLGPSFSRLHSKSELKKSLAAVTASLPMTCPQGVTPTPSATPRRG
jgi:hypothetical protein